VIDIGGPRCGCGNLGCLEACASGTALAREGYLVVKSRRPTKMAELVKGVAEDVTAETVFQAARQGDHEAMLLVEREGMLVGVGVVNCIHSFNPQLVVLGGGVSGAKELLFDPVRATVEDRIMPAYKGTFQIVPAALGGDTGALGAVAAALVELKQSH
jgi:glucokinase